MLFKSLVLAASASAYLVVPPVSGVEGGFRALPIEPINAFALPVHAFEQSISVPCPQCEGGDNLKLDFSISRNFQLMLHGLELYPNPDLWNGDFVASLVSEDGKERKQRLDCSLDIKEGLLDTAQDLQVVDVELKVFEVGDQYVDRLPAVHVQLIKGSQEGLSLGKVSLKEASEPEGLSLLKLAKAFFSDVWDSIKDIDLQECSSFMFGNTEEVVKDQDAQNQTDFEGSLVHTGLPDEQTDEPFRGTDWRQFVINVASHIFLPVLLGVVAGGVIAVVTMALYNIAVGLTRVVKSKRCCGGRCCRKKQSSHRREADFEKTGLMSGYVEEQLPQYCDEVPKN